jgi:hypothetical protein
MLILIWPFSQENFILEAIIFLTYIPNFPWPMFILITEVTLPTQKRGQSSRPQRLKISSMSLHLAGDWLQHHRPRVPETTPTDQGCYAYQAQQRHDMKHAQGGGRTTLAKKNKPRTLASFPRGQGHKVTSVILEYLVRIPSAIFELITQFIFASCMPCLQRLFMFIWLSETFTSFKIDRWVGFHLYIHGGDVVSWSSMVGEIKCQRHALERCRLHDQHPNHR